MEIPEDQMDDLIRHVAGYHLYMSDNDSEEQNMGKKYPSFTVDSDILETVYQDDHHGVRAIKVAALFGSTYLTQKLGDDNHGVTRWQTIGSSVTREHACFLAGYNAGLVVGLKEER